MARHTVSALEESEARFHSLFDNIPLALFLTRPDGSIIEANPALVAMLGYPSRDALLATNAFAHYADPADRQRYVEALERTGVVRGFMTRLRRLDGTELHIELSALPVRGPDGRVMHIEGSMTDVTERHRANAELQLQAAALNAAANAIVITDREGAIVWVNSAFTDLSGFGAAEAIGKNPRDLVKSGVHDTALYKDLWDTVLAGRVWHGELTNRRKDGSLYPEEQTITPVKNAGGEITHFIAIKQDLTEAKRLEGQYLQAQKMDSVGHLAGGIAHDFNNLLGAITVFGELVAADMAADDPRQEDLASIQDAVRRATTLTRQLLAFSRRQVLHPRVLNLNDVITDVLRILSRLIGEDIELITELDAAPGSVRADTGQMEQVLLNLAVNARDAMPKGGQFRIATAEVHLDESAAHLSGLERAGDYVIVTISDTGIGMSPEVQARLFEPFFTTKGAQGTGLGLATVYGIVRQSGGSITVTSEAGKGSTFTIHLPRVVEQAEEQLEGSPEPESQRGSETVLLVEDDLAIRMAACTVLERLGYTLLVMRTGEEALIEAEAHEGDIHLVISDVVLPGLDGMSLIGRLRGLRPGIKALLVSGYPDDARARRGVDRSGIPFLEKPFNSAGLAKRVREVLDQRT